MTFCLLLYKKGLTVTNIPFLDRPPARQPYVLLSALLQNALTPSSIAEDILRTIIGDPNTFIPNIERLTDCYYATLLVPLRREGGKTPAMSDHPSPLDDFDKHLVTRQLTDREKALHRSNWTCPVTGIVEQTSPNGPKPLSLPHTLDVAHIIPYNLGQARDSLEAENKRRAWKALECFAGPEVRQFLDVPAIDSLENVVALQHDHHVAFGRFNLWFTEDPIDVNPNSYIVNAALGGHKLNGVCAIDVRGAIPSGEKVEFTNFYPELYPDVSRYLLRVHAAIAQVFHMIGGGEYIDDVFHNAESITQLVGDGSDWSILSERLSLIMAW